MKKFCVNCGSEINENSDICLNCGKKFKRVKKNTGVTWWQILLIIASGIGLSIPIICLTIYLGKFYQFEEKIPHDIPIYDNEENIFKELDKPFIFNDLKVTINNEFNIITEDNKDYIRVPVTITNISDDDNYLNMYYIKYFSPKGTELKDVTDYFLDKDSIEYAGELLPSASYTKYFYFPYDGDGEYTIRLKSFDETIKIKINIKKTL